MDQHESGIHPMNNRKQGGPPSNLAAKNMGFFPQICIHLNREENGKTTVNQRLIFEFQKQLKVLI
jgi:hypothetical protein